MSLKHMIVRRGIGFSPGKAQYIVTKGLEIGPVPVNAGDPLGANRAASDRQGRVKRAYRKG